MPLTVVALVTVETVVTHADATSFVSVMVVKRTMLTSCPTVICDVHCPAWPSDKTEDRE